jgi:hypothetical protein
MRSPQTEPAPKNEFRPLRGKGASGRKFRAGHRCFERQAQRSILTLICRPLPTTSDFRGALSSAVRRNSVSRAHKKIEIRAPQLALAGRHSRKRALPQVLRRRLELWREKGIHYFTRNPAPHTYAQCRGPPRADLDQLALADRAVSPGLVSVENPSSNGFRPAEHS